jgi:hypothetical protein
VLKYKVSFNYVELELSYDLFCLASSSASCILANLILWFLSHSTDLGELKFQVWLNSVNLQLSYELFSLAGSLAGSMQANLIFWFLVEFL